MERKVGGLNRPCRDVEPTNIIVNTVKKLAQPH